MRPSLNRVRNRLLQLVDERFLIQGGHEQKTTVYGLPGLFEDLTTPKPSLVPSNTPIYFGAWEDHPPKPQPRTRFSGESRSGESRRSR